MQSQVMLNNLSALQFNEECAPIVDALCAPLFMNFGITHFGCIRIFKNGQLLRIANNKEWTRKYFECEFYNDLDIYSMDQVPLNKCHYVPLIGAPFNAHCKALCLEFNIWNFMLVYERFSTYGDFWFFGTTKENHQIINFYLNNKDLLSHFTFYFKDKANDLFNLNNSSKLISTKIAPLKGEGKLLNCIEKIEEEINSNYFLDKRHNGKSLSKRESECLFFFSQGRTMKETAERMELSPRTVETHINNMKHKFNCHTRGELLSKFSTVKTLF